MSEHRIEPKAPVLSNTERSRRRRKRSTEVECLGCGRRYPISVDSLRKHNGYCPSCAQTRRWRKPMRQARMFIAYAWRHRRFWASGWGTTEGCSFVPDFDFKPCCDAHDRHYLLHDVTRAEADERLYDCVLAHGHPYIAWVYWAFVRAFGAAAWNRTG